MYFSNCISLKYMLRVSFQWKALNKQFKYSQKTKDLLWILIWEKNTEKPTCFIKPVHTGFKGGKFLFFFYWATMFNKNLLLDRKGSNFCKPNIKNPNLIIYASFRFPNKPGRNTESFFQMKGESSRAVSVVVMQTVHRLPEPFSG